MKTSNKTLVASGACSGNPAGGSGVMVSENLNIPYTFQRSSAGIYVIRFDLKYQPISLNITTDASGFTWARMNGFGPGNLNIAIFAFSPSLVATDSAFSFTTGMRVVGG